MASRNIHVVPAGNGWAVETEGDNDRTMFFSQEEAIAAATQRAEHHKVELLIHGRDGQIHSRSAFCPAPRAING